MHSKCYTKGMQKRVAFVCLLSITFWACRGGPPPATAVNPPRASQRTKAPCKCEIATALDGFHAAAARADEDGYFASFAPDGVFLGTDGSERWDVQAFRAYAHPHFADGKAWTYVARDRHVTFARDANTAWFDERLDNEKYGEMRGSGVLVKLDGAWKIAQYNLSFTIPNSLAPQVVALRKAKVTVK